MLLHIVKRSLFILVNVLCVVQVGQAQTIVSTQPSNRTAIIEQFNGGPYCPDAHRISDSICNANPNDVLDVRYYEFTFTYNTEWGDSLVDLIFNSNNQYYPGGSINRHRFDSLSDETDCLALVRNKWAAGVDSILSMTSPVNIAATANIDETTRLLTVDVELYYTDSSASSTNMLNVILLQNNLKSWWNGASTWYPQMVDSNDLYRHMHVVRHMITGQWGDIIDTTTAGSFIHRTYSYVIPDSIRNVAINDFCDLEIVAFVSESNQEILSACRASYAGNSTFQYSFQCDTSMGTITHYDCYSSGTTIMAIPKPGFRFVRWSNGSTANPESLNITSDTTIVAIFAPLLPSQELCMVTVHDGHNMIIWNKEVEVQSYRLYRESSVADEYVIIAEIPFDSLSVYMDSESRPLTRSYRYMIGEVDEYGYETMSSTIHKTMHLTINQGMGNQWNLVWTEYEGAGYTTYVIYRGTNASDMQQIDVIPSGGNTTYTDPDAPAGNICYQVGVLMTTPCNPSKTETICRSNIATNGAVGIIGTNEDEIYVYTIGDRVFVDGNNGKNVCVYDMAGRLVASTNGDIVTVPNPGVYLVKMGNATQKIVVL